MMKIKANLCKYEKHGYTLALMKNAICFLTIVYTKNTSMFNKKNYARLLRKSEILILAINGNELKVFF